MPRGATRGAEWRELDAWVGNCAAFGDGEIERLMGEVERLTGRSPRTWSGRSRGTPDERAGR